MASNIKWRTNDNYPIGKVKPTPNNYKLKTEEGGRRLDTSLKDYGLAGSIIINLDGTLINGNSRWERAKKAGDKTISVSYPNRQLSPKEFKEFAALFDFATAGEIDLKRIKDELGTTDSFFKKWGIAIPTTALNKLAELEKVDKVVNPTASRKIDSRLTEITMRQLTLVYSNDEAEDILAIAEVLYSKLKVDNLSDLVMKLFKEAKKTYGRK